jgi:hypothetical protein
VSIGQLFFHGVDYFTAHPKIRICMPLFTIASFPAYDNTSNNTLTYKLNLKSRRIL